jgi:glutaredoxin
MTTAIVWSKYHCPYCDQAKALLKQRNISFEERKIGDGYTKEELLEAIPTARTVPQIVINGNLIGSAGTPNTAGKSVYDGGGVSWGTLYGWKFFGRRSSIRVYNKIFNQTDVTQNWNFFRPRFGL